MKKIITFLSMLFCLFATAQEVTDTMYIYRNDNIIERIPVSKIDSVVFVAPKAPAVPDVPETPVYEAIDLGLPSGVKWATCNVGATSPEESGAYRIWSATTYDWGNNWRMPTKDDFQELINNCTWSWITQNGVNGIEFTSSNGNRIFLPAAGYGSGSTLYEFGSAGFYWSSTSYDIYNSFPLLFNHNGCSVTDYMSREYSLSIRLVFSEN